jgi:hypothetical protein
MMHMNPRGTDPAGLRRRHLADTAAATCGDLFPGGSLVRLGAMSRIGLVRIDYLVLTVADVG